ncbi:MAG: hypothetical protein ACFFCO_09250 [Promethearchaeota archaeon]
MKSKERRLQLAFLVGAVVDAIATIPMLVPLVANLLWGFTNFSGEYFFAMGMGASLMIGWTLLLLWAYQKPAERRFVALLTLVVILGIMTTGILAAATGVVSIPLMIPTWLLQGILLGLFSGTYLGSKNL